MKISDLTDSQVVLTDDYASFDGVGYFGRTTQTVYLDKEGRYFSSEEEPKFNPFTGILITDVFECGEIEGLDDEEVDDQ